MKYMIAVAALLVAPLAAPAVAGSQVIASPGVTLTEAAQAKFNRDTRGDDRIAFVQPVAPSGEYDRLAAAAGLSEDEAEGMSLADIFVAKINREARGDEKQLGPKGAVVMSSRSPASGRAQLVASAGLTADEAANLSLTEIARAKFERDTDSDNR